MVWGMQTSHYLPVPMAIHADKRMLEAQTTEEGTALNIQGCLISAYTARWGKKRHPAKKLVGCFYIFLKKYIWLWLLNFRLHGLVG